MFFSYSVRSACFDEVASKNKRAGTQVDNNMQAGPMEREIERKLNQPRKRAPPSRSRNKYRSISMKKYEAFRNMCRTLYTQTYISLYLYVYIKICMLI